MKRGTSIYPAPVAIGYFAGGPERTTIGGPPCQVRFGAHGGFCLRLVITGSREITLSCST